MGEKIPDEFRSIFADKRAYAFVATVMDDGTPQVTPVWIDLDGDDVVFNTATGRVKWENIRRNPQVAVAVQDPANPYRYIQVRGRARMTEEGADEHIDALANKYLGVEQYQGRSPGERRVKVRVAPENVQVMG